MASWQFLALFLTALSGSSAAAAYNYKCLLPQTGGADLAAGIKQFQVAKLKQKMPGCTSRRHYCNYFVLLFTDKQRERSDAYILAANWRDCEASKARIVDALGNESTKLDYQNLQTRCTNITVGKVAGWMSREYAFRVLEQCLDVACQDGSVLADWQKDQLGYCRRYLNE